MKKVMIVGCSGAGKSTFAVKLHQITGLPICHLDQYYWKPGWVEPSAEEWEKIHNSLIKKDEWILDGNYGGTMKSRMLHADTIIFIDRSTITCLFRIIKRFLAGKRVDLIQGCKERLNWSFIHYVMMYNFTRRSSILKRFESLKQEKNTHIFRSEKSVHDFLNHVKKSRNQKTPGLNQ